MVPSLCINETSKDTRVSLGIWGGGEFIGYHRHQSTGIQVLDIK